MSIASGGKAMLLAAREAIDKVSGAKPLLVAVTVLTSFDEAALADIGVPGSIETQVLRLAKLSQACGMDGVVCSPREIAVLRQQCGADFCLVTPGVRFETAIAGDDQHRVATPTAALQAGASYLVIGRPVTQAANPVSVLNSVNQL